MSPEETTVKVFEIIIRGMVLLLLLHIGRELKILKTQEEGSKYYYLKKFYIPAIIILVLILIVIVLGIPWSIV